MPFIEDEDKAKVEAAREQAAMLARIKHDKEIANFGDAVPGIVAKVKAEVRAHYGRTGRMPHTVPIAEPLVTAYVAADNGCTEILLAALKAEDDSVVDVELEAPRPNYTGTDQRDAWANSVTVRVTLAPPATV